METLLNIAVWLVLIFLMMRFGHGAHVMGQGRAGGQPKTEPTASSHPKTGYGDVRWVAPEKDTDPVCGRTVTTSNAKPSVHAGNVYYFCSRECREIFEAAPDLYLGGSDSIQPRQLEHSHA